MSRRKSPAGQSEGQAGDGGPRPVPGTDAGGALVPADPAPDPPPAHQSFDRRGRVLRYAVCPEHYRVSRRYVGVIAAGWVFFCAVGPHRFTATPDPTAPQTAYEAQAAAVWAVANPRH